MHRVGILLDQRRPCRAKQIDLVEAAVHDSTAKALVLQVVYHEIIGFRHRDIVKFQVYPAYPKAVSLQSLDQMAADTALQTNAHLAAPHSPPSLPSIPWWHSQKISSD
jgi:hypothetical protein